MTVRERSGKARGAQLRTGRAFATLAAALVSTFIPLTSAAQDPAAEIQQTLRQWTEHFNAGRADQVCDLFARELVAQFRGQPERGYDAQCSLLQKALAPDARQKFQYALAIKEIIVEGDLAVVRLTWTLRLTQADGRTAVSEEPGLDVFRRSSVDGRWRIIRYMAYD